MAESRRMYMIASRGLDSLGQLTRGGRIPAARRHGPVGRSGAARGGVWPAAARVGGSRGANSVCQVATLQVRGRDNGQPPGERDVHHDPGKACMSRGVSGYEIDTTPAATVTRQGLGVCMKRNAP